MRKLPVYILLDTSGSMSGEPIQAVNVGLRAMMTALLQDPHALESVHVSIITYDREVNVVVPLTALDELRLPEIVAPQSGPTLTGLGLEVLIERVNKEVSRSSAQQKADWMPLLFLMTDGSPSDMDLYEEKAAVVRTMGFGNIIGLAAGPKAKKQSLLLLTPNVVSLDTMDSASFSSLFKWVSSAVSSGNLPPPPSKIVV